VYADEIADAAELKLLHKLVIGLGFNKDQASQVVQKALDTVASGIDEDDFIKALKH